MERTWRYERQNVVSTTTGGNSPPLGSEMMDMTHQKRLVNGYSYRLNPRQQAGFGDHRRRRWRSTHANEINRGI